MQLVILQGLAAFRWAAWVWMVAALAIGRPEMERPQLAIAGAAAALAVTAWATAMLHARPDLLVDRRAVVAEVAVGAALLVVDGLVSASGSLFTTRQSLGSAWPFTGILTAGVAGGPLAGVAAGIGLGFARVMSVAVNDSPLTETARVLSLLNTTVFYALAGGAAGYVARLVMRAEKDISAARARDEVARTLHDGVLQTLALVERRADDPALARLAREQEQELRAFLAGSVTAQAGDLIAQLYRAAAEFEERFGGRVSVVAADDLPRTATARQEAVVGAVREALANAGKHGRATSATVFVEPQNGGLFCSVRDDGVGFDPASTMEGMGTRQSIRGRVTDVGGTVDVLSRPGDGTEVCLWVP